MLPEISAASVRAPVLFEANRGQAPAGTEFVARGQGYSLMLSSGRLEWRARNSQLTAVIEGARPARAEAEEQAPGVVHYLIGGNPEQWVTDVPAYERVRYRGIYPGTDVVYYSSAGRVEYDFVVAPGADPGRIRLRFENARRVRVDEAGDLVLDTGAGSLRQHRPVMYQEGASGRQTVTGRFVVRGNVVRFAVARYDRTRPLVIDPALVWASYFGSTADEMGEAVALDAAGNIYLVGTTVGPSGYADAYYAKLTPDGTSAVYTSILGGSYDTYGHAIAVDSQGNVYLAGETDTPDFPFTNYFSPYPGYYGDAFLTKVDPNGKRYLFSYVIGGTGEDVAFGVTVDNSNNVWIVGATNSPAFPVTNGALQTKPAGVDAFATEFDASGNPLYSTLLGGSGDDYANAVAAGGDGSVYITGSTNSTNLPGTTAALQPKLAGGSDAFVVKLSSTGSLAYATYLGGTADDIANAIAVDGSGAAYVTGATASTDFPLQHAAQSALSGTDGKTDIFVSKLDPAAGSLVYSTYLGGAAEDSAYGIAVDGGGNAFLAGYTLSKDFPIKDGFQQAPAGPMNAIVATLDASGTPLFSSYLGGSGDGSTTGGDYANAAALNCGVGLVVAGTTVSKDFPVTAGVVSASANGGLDAFVARVGIGTKASIQAAGVVNAATQAAGPVAPGSVVSILGSGLALAGAAVMVNGNPAAVITAADARIDFQLPADSSLGDSKVTVTVPCGATDPATFTIAAVAPYLKAAVLNDDGTPNNADHPAKAGSVITATLTGTGPLDPMPTATAIIGGSDATLQSLAAGDPGWALAKILVPQLSTGSYPVGITIAGTAGGGATVFVQ